MNTKTLKQFSAAALTFALAGVALAGPERPFPAAVVSSQSPAVQTALVQRLAARTVAVDATVAPVKPVTTATTHARQSAL